MRERVRRGRGREATIPDKGLTGEKVTTVVTHEDRELLAELARLNGDMASLALRIMDGSASAAEQRHYAQRLIAGGERLKRPADRMGGAVIEGEIVVNGPIALPMHTVELDWES